MMDMHLYSHPAARPIQPGAVIMVIMVVMPRKKVAEVCLLAEYAKTGAKSMVACECAAIR
jgi:hypothetical protein